MEVEETDWTGYSNKKTKLGPSASQPFPSSLEPALNVGRSGRTGIDSALLRT